jgi:penicillin-insensitive murein endopeptidase
LQIIVRPTSLAVALASTVLTFTLGAWPGAPPRRTAIATRVTAGALRFGRSLGSPTEGHLLGGVRLDETPYLRIAPVHAHDEVRWGLEPLVDAIDRAARAVRRQFPDAVTTVGHLSRAGGGEIERHHSHESGRDADVQFFVRNRSGKPMLSTSFASFRADGTSPSWPGAYFDDVRNWVFVHALLTDPEARVTHIFVAAPLRARLLAIAEHLGASVAVRMHAAEILTQPRGALPHDDHFHVRIGCPSHMTGCIENPAMAHAIASRHGVVTGHARGVTPIAHPHAAPIVPHKAAKPDPTPPESGERDDGDLDVPAIIEDSDGPGD